MQGDPHPWVLEEGVPWMGSPRRAQSTPVGAGTMGHRAGRV